MTTETTELEAQERCWFWIEDPEEGGFLLWGTTLDAAFATYRKLYDALDSQLADDALDHEAVWRIPEWDGRRSQLSLWDWAIHPRFGHVRCNRCGGLTEAVDTYWTIGMIAFCEDCQWAVDDEPIRFAAMKKVVPLIQALEHARHQLVTLYGLTAADGMAPDQTWTIDENDTVEAIDAALSGGGS